MSVTFTAPAPEALQRVSLENGDRLYASEFLRRFEAMPDVKKAELVGSTVFMASPVSTMHGKPDGTILGLLYCYASKHPDLAVYPNTTLILSSDDVIQPDSQLQRLPEAGGKSMVTDKGYVRGSVELVAEVARSSVSIDAGDKMDACRRGGVGEYLLWLVDDGVIQWWRLEDDQYVEIEPDSNGVAESSIFPGLRLDFPAMLAFDAAKVLAAIK